MARQASQATVERREKVKQWVDQQTDKFVVKDIQVEGNPTEITNALIRLEKEGLVKKVGQAPAQGKGRRATYWQKVVDTE